LDLYKDAGAPAHDTRVEATFTSSSATLRNFSMQVAVPKYLKSAIQPASGNTVQPGMKQTQTFTITNSMHGQKPLMLRLKLDFSPDAGSPVSQIVTVSGLPRI
jgi:AP-1 complex subunit gamma-1